MYIPAHFREDNLASLHDIIRNFSFATFVTHGSEGLQINHIPVLLDPDRGPYGTLIFHLARANPQWRNITPESEAVLIFVGPHRYVTPSWYATKQETGRVVPTWDYIVVHASGPITVFEDAETIRSIVTRLTIEHESHRETPWKVQDAPDDYVAGMLKAIVGLEMRIERIEGKAKLSQNVREPDRQGVITGLESEAPDGAALAAAIKKAARTSSK